MAFSQTIDEVVDDLTQRSRKALAERRAQGEIMTYVRDGWVFREFPGIRVERICRLEDYKSPGQTAAGEVVCQD